MKRSSDCSQLMIKTLLEAENARVEERKPITRVGVCRVLFLFWSTSKVGRASQLQKKGNGRTNERGSRKSSSLKWRVKKGRPQGWEVGKVGNKGRGGGKARHAPEDRGVLLFGQERPP
jgi:hypothetical protein